MNKTLPIILRTQYEENLQSTGANRFFSIFENHYLPSIDADWSQVKSAIDVIKADGVSDIRGYFAQNPSEVSRLRGLIVRRRLNGAVLNLFRADSIDSFEAYVCDEVGAIDRFEIYRNAFSAFEQGERYFEFEGKETAIDGSLLTTRTKFVRIGDDLDDWSQVLVTIVGITAQSSVAESADFARRLPSRKMTGGVAHEFNTILTIIQGCTELISSDCDIDCEMKRHILDAVTRGAGITYGLLSYSHNQQLREARVSVEALVEEAIQRFSEKSGTETIICSAFPEGLWPCQLDAKLFVSSIVNLLTNADEAMPNIENARIEISFENLTICENEARKMGVTAGDYVVVNVTDGGHGMSETVRSQAFDPFFTTKQSDKCAGIGLSAVHGFVSQSGGFINIESAPGCGATVILGFSRAYTSA